MTRAPSSDRPERCADAAEERGDALAGTASVVQHFLLVEEPGPWGPHVLHSSRLPDDARAALRRWKRKIGLRTLLVRRPEADGPDGRRDRDASGPRQLFAVNARLERAWTQTVERLDDLADLDLSHLPVGGPSVVPGAADGWVEHHDPLLLVCTHGKHDPCCAIRGRPLAAAVANEFPGLAWEASHLGGDRFAGNLLVLPRGDMFGRLDATTGPDAVRRYLDGHLDLDHHRGATTKRWVIQAAVHAARRATGATGFEAVRPLAFGRDGDRRRVDLTVQGHPVTAWVRITHTEPAFLTCHARAAEPAPTYAVEFDPPLP